MTRFLDWLDHRTGIRGLVHEALYENIPGGARWKYVWGSALVFAFSVQAVTGIVLWMAYSPSTQTAWESVFYIQNEMAGGWLLRSLHHYMAQVMVVLLALHLMQVVICGAYRAPREINFWLGLVLSQIVLGLALTGYLLPWDQKGYWATSVATRIMGLTGDAAQQLAVGGSQYGHHTLTRFFAMHAGVLPALLTFFLVLHVAIFRRHGIHAPNPERKPDATFWPDQVLKDGVACLAVLAVVLGLSLWRPAELAAPADAASPYDARPEWYFLFLFQMLKYFPGNERFLGFGMEFWGAIVVPGVIFGVMALMPILGRWRLGHAFNLCFLACLTLGICLLTAQAYYEDHHADWDPKDTSKFAKDPDRQKKYEAAWDASRLFLDAVAQAERDAERVRELALSPTRIPPTGAKTLLRNDPLTQGPRLFAARCAGCHSRTGADEASSVLAKVPSAPDLGGFGTRAWISGLFDPAKITGPSYFGNSAHLKEGQMVGWVKDTASKFEPEQRAQLEKAVIALSAEASLPSQQEQDAKDSATIEDGRKLIAETVGCIDCHTFGGEGTAGQAPDLTGYASREWLIGMISNPNHERYYSHVGAEDQPMPAFGSQLSPEEIGLLADWIRGDWYRPPQPAVESP